MGDGLADKVLQLSQEEAPNKANLSSLLHDQAKERRDARHDEQDRECVNLYIFTVLWIHKLSFSYAVEQLKDVHLVEQLHHHLAHRARIKAIYRLRVSKRGQYHTASSTCLKQNLYIFTGK